MTNDKLENLGKIGQLKAEPAQKLLSAVYRTGQRFGAAHVVDVLLGKDTDKIRQHGHEQLSVSVESF